MSTKAQEFTQPNSAAFCVRNSEGTFYAVPVPAFDFADRQQLLAVIDEQIPCFSG